MGVVGWVVEGFMGWVGGGWVAVGVGGWRVHGVAEFTHPPMNSYNVKIFNFMNTHPPTYKTDTKCHSVTTEILWRADEVGGGEVVGGFTGWVGEWWGGWFEGS